MLVRRKLFHGKSFHNGWKIKIQGTSKMVKPDDDVDETWCTQCHSCVGKLMNTVMGGKHAYEYILSCAIYLYTCTRIGKFCWDSSSVICKNLCASFIYTADFILFPTVFVFMCVFFITLPFHIYIDFSFLINLVRMTPVSLLSSKFIWPLRSFVNDYNILHDDA